MDRTAERLLSADRARIAPVEDFRALIAGGYLVPTKDRMCHRRWSKGRR